MARIKLLDEQLANQIAAGEVVERPSSVVKELVENAIDAGSTTIDVTIEEGGLTYIRVVDNGDGIAQEDLLTAFERHATSKISTSSDLFRIASLGFRGEALPSIAAVAKVECVSTPETTGLAHRVLIEGGKLTANEPANAPKGTSITVRDLFFNTPARLKYMKTVQTELGHISDYMNRIALAHPGIAITLKHNGNMLIRTLGNGDRLQVIAAIYGTSTAKMMLTFDASDPDYELIGYISKPEFTRANRNAITIIVNGRYIKSIACNHAILEGYHTLLPINRFPLVVLEIQMHPALLDVNVHPSKLEVRFSKEQELKTLIEQAIREKLGNLRYTPGIDSIKPAPRQSAAFVQDSISFHVEDRGMQAAPAYKQAMSNIEQSGSGSYAGGASTSNFGKYERGSSSYPTTRKDQEKIPADATERLYANAQGKDISELRSSAPAIDPFAVVRERASFNPEAASPFQSKEQLTAPEEGKRFPELHWIGQHHGTYIIAQSEDGLYLIDQHAAHERINYEYYFEKFGNPEQASQQLLVPLTLEFTAGEAENLRSLLPYLEQAGVVLEPFGAQTYLVRAYPQWLPEGDEAAIVEEMIDYVLRERKKIDLNKFREEAAIMCSCKASIKANDRMTREEGEGLLRQLAQCQQPYTCPHGRPIIVHLSTYQLEKMFKRVMS